MLVKFVVFDLPEVYRYSFVGWYYAEIPAILSNVVECIIDLPLKIVLEKLGPSLWENKLNCLNIKICDMIDISNMM